MKLQLEAFQSSIQKQSQSLSTMQQFSLRILQMNVQQLDSLIEESMENNPVIEIDEQDFSDSGFHHADFDLLTNFYPAQTTLEENFLYQLHTYPQDIDQSLGEFLIYSLDENGFLTCTPSEIAKYCNQDIQNILSTLHVLQQFEPVVCFCQNLQESLLVQLKHKYLPQALSVQLIENHINLLQNQDYVTLQSVSGCTPEELKEAMKQIRQCNPTPASAYRQQIEYIKPDIILTKADNKIIIQVVEPYHIRMNEDYQHLSFLKPYLSSARQLMDSLKMRKKTLIHLVEYLIQKQSDFFYQNGSMKPLQMKEAALALQVHESTISRCVASKYLEWEGTVYALKSFFPPVSGNEWVENKLKSTIQSMIKNEDPTLPLSDQKIADLLKKQGIDCARRTVQKYRTQLHIPSAKQRKIGR